MMYYKVIEHSVIALTGNLKNCSKFLMEIQARVSYFRDTWQNSFSNF